MKGQELNKLSNLGDVFGKYNVVFAYLFGSQVEGNTGELSDIDIAIYFDRRITPPERFNKKLKLMDEISQILKIEEIDIVVLNDAYPLLEHRIIKQGVVIFSCDEEERIEYEVRAVMRYLDFKPYIEKYTEGTLHSG